MPPISVFYGILIQTFWRDLAPPHFDALYAEDEALIDSDVEGDPGELAEAGAGTGAAVASEHRAELMEDWDLCAQLQTPREIEPLR